MKKALGPSAENTVGCTWLLWWRSASHRYSSAPVGSSASEDPSFSLLGDLAGNLDWDSAAEAGISTEVGAADGALTDLNDAERAELRRLLREEMSHAGA